MRKFFIFVRRLSAIALGFATVVVALICFAIISPYSSQKTIEKSKQIEKIFEKTSEYINNYRKEKGDKPGYSELNSWIKSNLESPYWVCILTPNDGNWEEAVKMLGQPPNKSYILGLWRGEWFEYYAPWSGKSSLIYNPEAYTLTGSTAMDILLGCFFTGLFAFGTWRLWR